jgi:hypothetical protein
MMDLQETDIMRTRIKIASLLLISVLVFGFATISRTTVANTGGPDLFGYTWTDSNLPIPTVSYSWDDIQLTGTNIGSHSDDGVFGPFSIGFTFIFYGNSFSQFCIGNNGGIILSTGACSSLSPTNNPIPSGGLPNDFVAVFWDDLYEAGDIIYETKGSSPNRYLVVQWQDIDHFDFQGAGFITFQVMLYETTHDIKLQYQDAIFGDVSVDRGSSASSGIENSVGSDGLQYSYNSAILDNALAILFTPPAGGLCSGTVLLTDDSPRLCDTPSPDNFEFDVVSFDHAVIGIRSPSAGDYDISLFEDNTMADFIESSNTSNSVDLVALDKGVWSPSPNKGAMTSVALGSGNYQVEMENDVLDISGMPFTRTGSMTNSEVVDAYEILGALIGNTYNIVLTVPPTADFDMFLFDFSGDDAQNRVEAPWSSTNVGAGVQESISFTGTIGGQYLLVMTNQDGGSGAFTLNGFEIISNILTVGTNPVTSGAVMPGQTNAVIERLTLTSNTGTIVVTDIKLDRGGTGTDSDTSSIYLYDDVNNDGDLDIGTDVLKDTQLFAGGTLTFTGFTVAVTSGTQENLLIVFDISATATLGRTLNVTLVNETYVSVPAPSSVSSSNFPIRSGTKTINDVITGNIIGVVIDENNEPINNVLVELFDSSNVLQTSEATGLDGKFDFMTLDAGTDYYVRLKSEGYEILIVDQIEVIAGQTTNLDDIELVTDAVIKGEVLKPDNMPLVGAKLKLLDKDGNVVATVFTDDDGEYRFEGLAYGEYTIEITADDYENANVGPITIGQGNVVVTNDDIEMEVAGQGSGGSDFLSNYWWLLLLIVVVVVVLLAVMILMAKRRKKPSSVPPGPQGTASYIPPGQKSYQPQQPPQQPPPGGQPSTPPPPPPAR